MKASSRILLVLVVVVLLLGSVAPTWALDKQARLNAMSAVVQVSLVRVQGKQIYTLPWGSGSIISSDGLIMTNCHVADPRRFGLSADEVPDYDYLGIGLTVKSDQPPQLAYLGEVVQADPVLDLAIVRITHKTDLTPVKTGALNLPFVELGDSDEVEVGDDLNIFGYPGIGGETVTFTRGVISGFTLASGIEGRAWIKTDASISGGNSGGMALDEEGLLIGVPTRAGVGGGTEPVDCRPVKDTNGDGTIDSNDDCVPVGGFINALRPVNLGKPLAEAARRGLPDSGRQATPETTDEGKGTAKLGNLVFSAGVNEFDQPTQLVTRLPSGSRSLYLFFDYDGMDSGKTFEMKLLLDGQERPDWGLPSAPWSGVEQGMSWIGWGDTAFADGIYELVLYVQGEEMARARIQVGGAADTGPRLSDVVLSLEATTGGEPAQPAVLFPAGATELLAFFSFANMSNGVKWTHSWLVDGKEVLRKDDTWSEGRSGRTSLTLTNQRGLPVGAYRLNLYVNGKLAALSNFWVTGKQGASASFGQITFASGVDQKGKPVGAAQSFSAGLKELHAFADYSGMEDGISFQVNWFIDDEKVLESPYAWDGGESGSWHYRLYSESGALPSGKYSVELLAQGQLLQNGTTTVGSGRAPQPTPIPQTKSGVQVQGHIVDLDTERPIPGAVFLVLKPGITLDTFQWTDSELFTSAEADEKGVYKLPRLLDRGDCYTVIIGAENYWAYGEDDVCFTENDPSSIDLTVYLEKK